MPLLGFGVNANTFNQAFSLKWRTYYKQRSRENSTVFVTGTVSKALVEGIHCPVIRLTTMGLKLNVECTFAGFALIENSRINPSSRLWARHCLHSINICWMNKWVRIACETLFLIQLPQFLRLNIGLDASHTPSSPRLSTWQPYHPTGLLLPIWHRWPPWDLPFNLGHSAIPPHSLQNGFHI